MFFIPEAEPPVPSDERIRACVVACNGLSTEQLVAMNAIETGTLARAYDVCSDLWEWFGIEIIGQHPINTYDALRAIQDNAEDLEAVVQWGRETGAEP